MARILPLSALFLALILAFYNAEAKFNSTDCNQLNKNVKSCHCAEDVPNKRFTLECKDAKDHQIMATFDTLDNNYVTFKCNKSTNGTYELLTKLELGQRSILKFDKCPLPATLALRRFNILQVDNLLMENAFYGATLRADLKDFKEIRALSLIHDAIIPSMASNALADLTQLQDLQLTHNNMSLFEKGVFASLRELRTLDVSYNLLEQIPPGTFDSQSKLESLRVSHNKLKQLNMKDLSGLVLLDELDLSQNELKELPADVFSQLQHLHSIKLDGNQLIELPKGLLTRQKQLSEFSLVGNRGVTLKGLPAAFFANLVHLTNVSVVSCGLKTLPDDLFYGSMQLRNIDLSHNELTALPMYLLGQLETLDLSYNKLQTLPAEFFDGMSKLRVLQLSHNNMKHLASSLFDGLSNLQELHLDHNQLQRISVNAFDALQNLRQLSIAHNQLSTYDFVNSFRQLNRLESLNLAKNSFTHLPPFLTMPELKDFDLSFNKLSQLSHDEWIFLTKGEVKANLTHNSISLVSFPWRSVEDKKLAVLDLNFNPQNCNCNLYPFASEYQKRNESSALKWSTITCMAPPSLKQQLVRKLDLNDFVCPIECAANCACWRRPHQTELVANCANRSLSILPAITMPKDLHNFSLHIEYNNFTKLDFKTLSFNGTERPLALDIYAFKNSITKMSNVPQELRLLDVHSNHFLEFDEQTTKALSKSYSGNTRLSLSKNLWSCDCSSKSMLHFVQARKAFIMDYDKLRCYDDTKFSDLTDLKLCSLLIFGIVVGVIAVLALVGVATCLCVRRRRQQRSYRP